jgi:hypothetical protein
VRDLLSLVTDENSNQNLPDGTGPRQLLWDLADSASWPTLCGATSPAPHDHGPSWAICGQARSVQVSEWRSWGLPARKNGKVKRLTTYTLKPGMAQLYNEGRPFSQGGAQPPDPHRGQNMDGVKPALQAM